MIEKSAHQNGNQEQDQKKQRHHEEDPEQGVPHETHMPMGEAAAVKQPHKASAEPHDREDRQRHKERGRQCARYRPQRRSYQGRLFAHHPSTSVIVTTGRLPQGSQEGTWAAKLPKE